MATELLRSEARSLFNRVRSLSTPESSEDEDGEAQRSFDSLRESLNGTKRRLDDKEPVSWRSHTAFCNRAGLVKYKSQSLFGREVALQTQAFFKFYELLGTYREELVRAPELSSFHLCEAPGAFITALEQYLLQTFGENEGWFWRASALNPYHEGNTTDSTTVDDRLIFDTMEKWIFHACGTGNIFHMKVGEQFDNRFDLVTADGSVDCQNDPAVQEVTVFPLFCVETRCALRLLKDGGSFVVKMFTFFEKDTRLLLQALRESFERVDVRKPSCSRSSNSEVYVVCLRYRRTAGLELADFLDGYVDEEGRICGVNSMRARSSFDRELFDISAWFAQLQIEAIDNHIRLHNDMTKRQREKLHTLKIMVADMYVHKFAIRKLPPEIQQKSKFRAKEHAKNQLMRGRAWNIVAFEERLQRNWWISHADGMLRRLQELHPEVFLHAEQDEIVYEKKCQNFKADLRVTTGLLFSPVTLSKYIEQSLLDLYLMMYPETAENNHNKVEKKICRTDDEVSCEVYADMSSIEGRKRFVVDLEDAVRCMISSGLSVSLTIAFSETLSRLAAGLVYIFAQIFDDVEFQASRLDNVCFTFSADSCDGIGEALKAIVNLREAIESCEPGLSVVEVVDLMEVCSSDIFKFLQHCNKRFYATNKTAFKLVELAGGNGNGAQKEVV